ncbi:MAG: S9 family peptidase [Thermaerobacter sp.]|nr:S9 family peptidase [Thermaerobacter sp.]
MPSEASQSSLIRLADVYRHVRLVDVAVSPDGRKVVYVTEQFRRSKDEQMHSIWIVDTDGTHPPHRLTRSGTSDSSPRFSPDGTLLAFLSARPDEVEIAEQQVGKDESEPKNQIWLFDLAHGGEPRQLTRIEEGVEEFSWGPDAHRIVFCSRVPDDEQRKYLKRRRDKDSPGPWVLRRTQHKEDGQGYLDDVRTHLFTLDVATRAVQQISGGPASETHPLWSPDGGWILFTSNRTGDPDNNLRLDLWLMRPDGSDLRRLTFGDVRAESPVWSPDSSRVAFTSPVEPENLSSLAYPLVVDVAAAEPTGSLAQSIGAGFASVGGIVADGPVADPVAAARCYPVPLRTTAARRLATELPGPAERLSWRDASKVLGLVLDHGQKRLVEWGVDGGLRILAPQDRQSTIVAFGCGGGSVVAAIDRPETGWTLTSLRETGLQDKPLVSPNALWLGERHLGCYRWIEWRDSDGVSIEGLVIVPPQVSGDPSRLPLLAVLHGGPQWLDMPWFDFERQYWADLGYLVLMVNYRGSLSYGEEFCRTIQGRWGPLEHDDLMTGIDEMVRRGWADPERLYCTGFSYGGIMTNWAVGHTDRFRAAASEHGLWDYSSTFGPDDSHIQWQNDAGLPWQNRERYLKMSPTSGAEHIRTPLLILAGEQDWRCPVDQSEQLYLTLKKRGVSTELIIYPGEHHAVSRPRRAIDRLRRIALWFAQHGGQPLPTEDTKDDEPTDSKD